ncbi:uncharacterized protein LOC133895313 [Phragmites australis]|uniref:uncharacterized protein LOC133895313 n=1 Tax=Phragmites australis TaxID=29695 RepID=UPI002D77A503|nr:uncharacterized protein LOC133895313 [Phragmites australis]
MESLSITAEAIAFTEKKMDMTLEDIIKMSKKKNPGGKKPPRQPIKKRPFQNGNANQENAKVQRFIESRSSIRQGFLAQRRSNLGGNQFPATKQAAKKAAAMPMRNRAVRWNRPSASTLVQRRPVGDAFQSGKGKETQNQVPRTMDALFAQMKAQRMKITPQQQKYPAPGHQFNQQRRVQQQRPGRGYGGRNVGNQ